MKYPRHVAGQSLVELALIVPLLAAIIFGIIELGIMLNIYISLTNSAREAARAGAIYQYSGPPFNITNTTQALAAAQTVDTQRAQYISTVLTNTLNPIVDRSSPRLQITISYTDTLDPDNSTTADDLWRNPYRAGKTVQVRMAYQHNLFFGLLGRREIILKAISAMRIEPGAVP